MDASIWGSMALHLILWGVSCFSCCSLGCWFLSAEWWRSRMLVSVLFLLNVRLASITNIYCYNNGCSVVSYRWILGSSSYCHQTSSEIKADARILEVLHRLEPELIRPIPFQTNGCHCYDHYQYCPYYYSILLFYTTAIRGPAPIDIWPSCLSPGTHRITTPTTTWCCVAMLPRPQSTARPSISSPTLCPSS